MPSFGMPPVAVGTQAAPHVQADVAPQAAHPHSMFETLKGGIAQAAGLVQASVAPLSHSPDGLAPAERVAPSDPKTPVGLFGTIYEQAKANTLGEGIKVAFHAATQASEPLDDRKLLLEEVVTFLGALPAESTLGSKLSDTLITALWDDLPHPPSTFIGSGRFRDSDGGANNLSYPDLGRANTAYARDVVPVHPLPNNLPDPGVVFDALLKRDKFVPHPSGISSMLFSFATLVIHSAFQTSRQDPSINEASSYLDLSPLYGNNQAEQNTVRTFKQGLLFPDVWASERLGLMPPHVVALLVMFCRNHNFLANKLFLINENNAFKPVSELTTEAAAKQDEVLFQTAKLINCAFFVNVVFYDYIRVILNQNTTTSTWALFPNMAIKPLGGAAVERGVGNSCSIEFNILYRWHSAISAEDEKWTEDLFKKVLPDKPFDKMTEADFMTAAGKLKSSQGTDRRTWGLGELKRDATTGLFADDDLCTLLANATEAPAGAFKARGSPACMRVIDMMGMAAARNVWKCCTLNEFRSFLNLQPFETFAEWNNDPKIWKVAEQLYVHVDNLELFPGLSAEQAKPSMAGSGLAPGYTVSRAILSDAVALVRGDRYFTTDYTPASLTKWGFEDVQPDMAGGSFGGVLGKILMRALPTCYSFNSVYALFSMSTPETTRKNLTKLGIVDKYDFKKPKTAKPWVPAFTYAGCMSILADYKTFGVIYAPNIKHIVNTEYGFFIGFDDMKNHARDRNIMDQAMFPPGYEQGIRKFYTDTTKALIAKKSWSYDDNKTFTLDVVRDVTTIASVLWVANTFGIPLKTESNPHGLMTPQELYLMLSAFFIFVFMNFDPQPGFMLRDAAVSHSKILGGIIGMRFAQITGVPATIDHLARELQDKLLGINANALIMSQDAHDFYTRLLKSDRPLEQLNASAQSIMTASTANQGEVAAHVINFYLAPDQKSNYDALVILANDPSEEADSKIWSYILEVMRLDPQAPGIPRVATKDGSFMDGEKEVKYSQGDMIFASMYTCGRDPLIFPEPNVVDITRDKSLYRVFGSGIHSCLGSKLVAVSMVAMIREVFKLKNLRRAPGSPGVLNRFHAEIANTPVPIYISPQSTLTPFPVTLSIVYDA
ncbi:linoleate 10R-lipoxygenase, partial [Phenoliferia sp. Uapishka_3]